MNWFRVRSRWWENLLLALAVVLLFRPGFFMDQIAPEVREVPGSQIQQVAQALPDNGRLAMVIQGTTLEGEEVRKTVALRLGKAGPDGRKRLADAGLQVMALGDQVQVSAVRFGSAARKSGVEQGFDIVALQVPNDRPSKHWFYLPGLALIALVWFTQGLRKRREAPLPQPA